MPMKQMAAALLIVLALAPGLWAGIERIELQVQGMT